MAYETRERDFPFTLTRDANADDGDGLTFEGYAAVFNTPAHIEDADGEYDEVIAPGAFRQTINRSKPILMFNHGKHPLIGPMPLGTITELREDGRGLFVKARLTDNWLIQPVRDAVRDGAVSGMSFRFETVKDQWEVRQRGGPRLRTLKEVKVPELGPVVMPAYEDTTASVRSAFSALEQAIPVTVKFEQRDAGDDDEECGNDDLVADAIEAHWGIDAFTGDVYVTELHDDYAIFAVKGADQGHKGLFRVDYTLTDGNVTIGEPTQVQSTGYVPVGADAPTDLEQWDQNLNTAPIKGETRATYTADQRKSMASSGQAMPDGSYPIANKADLSNAIHAVGRGGGSHNAIRKHIIKRARALGASDQIPTNWNPDGSMSGTNAQQEGSFETAAKPGPVKEAAVADVPRPPMTDAQQRAAYLRHLALQRRGVVTTS